MIKELKEVLIDDFWIMPATPQYINEGIPYITSKNIKNGKIDFNNVNYIDIENYKKISRNRPILIDDILISMIGTLGEIAIVKESDGIFYGQNMFLVRLDKNKIYQRYFVNYFKSNIVKRQLSNKQNKSTQSYLKANHIESLKIPLPDVDEQKKIAYKLDKLQEIIDIRKKQIEEIDELIKSQFVELFGDPIVNEKKWDKELLKKNITLLNGRAYSQEELLTVGKYPVLRVGNFFSNRGWYYSDLELENEKYCENGDLLYAWSASFGPKIWNGCKSIYHYHIWKVLYNNKYSKIFLYQLLYMQTQYLMNDTHGIGMLHLTKSGMEEAEFIVPPIELQNQFAEFVKQIDKQKLQLQKSLEEMQVLQESLMNKYFG